MHCTASAHDFIMRTYVRLYHSVRLFAFHFHKYVQDSRRRVVSALIIMADVLICRRLLSQIMINVRLWSSLLPWKKTKKTEEGIFNQFWVDSLSLCISPILEIFRFFSFRKTACKKNLHDIFFWKISWKTLLCPRLS